MELVFAMMFTLPCLMVSALICDYASYRFRAKIQPWVMIAGGLALLAFIDYMGVTDFVIQTLS